MALARSVNMSGILACISSVREVNTSTFGHGCDCELCTIADGQTPLLHRSIRAASILLYSLQEILNMSVAQICKE